MTGDEIARAEAMRERMDAWAMLSTALDRARNEGVTIVIHPNGDVVSGGDGGIAAVVAMSLHKLRAP